MQRGARSKAKATETRTEARMPDPVQRARAVVEEVAAAAPRIDEGRELPKDLVAALHRERLFRLLLPRAIGGEEVDLVTFAKVIGTVAAADASTGWCLSQGGGCAMAAAYLKPAAQKRLFGADDAVMAWGAGIQGKAVECDGGYRVTGKWTFASGSRHATILGAHSYVFDRNGRPVLRPDGRQLDRSALFPREKATIHDIWHVVGLKGTGSDTYVVNDLFVSADDTVDRENPAELYEAAPVFKFSATVVYGVGFSALMLGIARGLIDELTRLAMTKTQRAASTSLRESTVFQTRLAEMEARHRACTAYLHETARETYAEAVETGECTMDHRARLKLATTWCINEGVEIAIDAYRAAGNNAIFQNAGYERRMRDALTASQQTQGRGTNYVTVGRCLLGLEPDNNMFL